ncbi:MAG: redoxin domain-containing protein [Pyrinomonadaceae bacterium]|jgi:peroxiredoxin|nr:redoxin domain-containing protein [Blastocatellia bacterium]MCW5958322.1 redoxin domain-containing protein [Pyrinomonadaceae bacterium]
MQAYQADIAKFEAANTKVFGISMDAAPSLKAFAEQIKVTSVPFLSDWNRTVTKQYGLFNEANGYGRRATFVIDKEGKIAKVEAGGVAIDPTGAYEACDLLEKKLVVKPPTDKP